jgi:hypothetical protein
MYSLLFWFCEVLDWSVWFASNFCFDTGSFLFDMETLPDQSFCFPFSTLMTFQYYISGYYFKIVLTSTRKRRNYADVNLTDIKNTISHLNIGVAFRDVCSHALQMKSRWESNLNVWFSFMYSQKRNCYFQNRIIMFCLPVPTLIYLWDIFKFPGSVCLFCCREICGPILRIYKSLTDKCECGNWNLGRAIPRKGIHKWDFPCSAEDILGISDRGLPRRPEESCARGARSRAQNFLRLPQVFNESEKRRPLKVSFVVPVIKVGLCRSTCACIISLFVLFVVDLQILTFYRIRN